MVTEKALRKASSLAEWLLVEAIATHEAILDFRQFGNATDADIGLSEAFLALEDACLEYESFWLYNANVEEHFALVNERAIESLTGRPASSIHQAILLIASCGRSSIAKAVEFASAPEKYPFGVRRSELRFESISLSRHLDVAIASFQEEFPRSDVSRAQAMRTQELARGIAALSRPVAGNGLVPVVDDNTFKVFFAGAVSEDVRAVAELLNVNRKMRVAPAAKAVANLVNEKAGRQKVSWKGLANRFSRVVAKKPAPIIFIPPRD